MHAAGTLQVADITAAPPLDDLVITCINEFFVFLLRYYFQVLLKKGKIIFQQLSDILVLSSIVIRCLCHPFCYKSLEISSTSSNKSIK